MSSNSQKMVAISPTTNQWPQVDDQKVLNKVMEKADEEVVQQQHQQEALKCPRCESSNTKFCYYNNYSLSQPRHFCKACKRYWTRGGTLRNVPVGGGCRKNKRPKRPFITNNNNNNSCSSASASSNSNSSSAAAVPASQPQIDTASTSNHHISPLFYSSSDLNLPLFTRFGSRISTSGFDLHLNNALGLGFSSGVNMSSEVTDNRNGFGSNNTLLSSYNNSSMFGSSSAMSSLLSSNLLQQKFVNCGLKDGVGVVGSNIFQQGLGLTPLEELPMGSDNSEALKDVKVELLGQSNRFEWNGACQNQIQHMGLYDPSSLYWNNNNTATTALGTVWNDQATNIGSSVTSLI